MAMLIPIEGETSEVAPPKDRVELCTMLGGASTDGHTAPDGSSWWHATPLEVTPNERATRFLAARLGTPVQHSPHTLFGLVLYLSMTETNVLNGNTAEQWVDVYGKTYAVKESLKKIGARWDPDKRVWKVLQSRLHEAMDIVRKGP